MTPTLGGMVNSFLLVRFLGQSREREGEGERGPYLTALLLSQKMEPALKWKMEISNSRIYWRTVEPTNVNLGYYAGTNARAVDTTTVVFY